MCSRFSASESCSTVTFLPALAWLLELRGSGKANGRKTARIFRIILNLDGHNMLYLGVFEGSPVAFHTIWGLKTESADESNFGRYLIGKSVITSLSPGRELSELSRSRGDLLSRIRSFTLLGEQ